MPDYLAWPLAVVLVFGGIALWYAVWDRFGVSGGAATVIWVVVGLAIVLFWDRPMSALFSSGPPEWSLLATGAACLAIYAWMVRKGAGDIRYLWITLGLVLIVAGLIASIAAPPSLYPTN